MIKQSQTQKDKKTGKLSSQSINDIAKKAAEQLNKFIDNPSKYTVKKFTKQLVNDQAASSNTTMPRKNFIKRICEYLKDKWHGYSDDKSKLLLAEQLKNEAKFVGQKAKSHMSLTHQRHHLHIMKKQKVKEEVRKIFNRLLAAVKLCKKSNLRISWSNI